MPKIFVERYKMLDYLRRRHNMAIVGWNSQSFTDKVASRTFGPAVNESEKTEKALKKGNAVAAQIAEQWKASMASIQTRQISQP